MGGKSSGRPPADGETPRTVRRTVFLTEREAQEVDRTMRLPGETFSVFVRRMLGIPCGVE